MFNRYLGIFFIPQSHNRSVKGDFSLFHPFCTLPLHTRFPFFPLLGETQKGSGNDPGNHNDFAKFSPSFIGERGPGGEYKMGHFDHRSTIQRLTERLCPQSPSKGNSTALGPSTLSPPSRARAGINEESLCLPKGRWSHNLEEEIPSSTPSFLFQLHSKREYMGSYN